MQKLKNRQKRKESSVLNSAATSSFWHTVDKHKKADEVSNKQVSMPTGTASRTLENALLPNPKLNKQVSYHNTYLTQAGFQSKSHLVESDTFTSYWEPY